MNIYQQPTGWDHDQADPSAHFEIKLQHMALQQMNLPGAEKAMEQLVRERAEVQKAERNCFMARRCIYEDAGWPEESKFRRQRDEWNRRYVELVDPYVHGPKAAYWMQYEHGQAMRDTFEETAGPYAV